MHKAVFGLVFAASVGVSGCTLFRGPSSPDEFAVARNAPLVVPPDFSLTPPVAGTAGLSAGDAQQQAIDAIFGGPAPRSASETSLLEAAGRTSAQLGIRSTVADPGTRLVDKGATTIQIITAQPTQSPIASASAGQ